MCGGVVEIVQQSERTTARLRSQNVESITKRVEIRYRPGTTLRLTVRNVRIVYQQSSTARNQFTNVVLSKRLGRQHQGWRVVCKKWGSHAMCDPSSPRSVLLALSNSI